MEEFVKRAEELGLEVYQPTIEHDLIFSNWYVHLNESGDFDRIFTERLRPLSQFMSNFQSPTITAFARDDAHNVWICAWFATFSDIASGVFMHMWCREDMRGTREQYNLTHLIYSFATTAWPVVIGITKHEDLLHIHRKLGYHIVGTIPKMLDQQDVWVLYLTRELFEDSRFYKIGDRVNG